MLKNSLKDLISTEYREKDAFYQCIQSPTTAKILKVSDSETILGLKVLSAKYALQMKRLAQTDDASKGLIVCEKIDKINSIQANYTENGKINVQFPSVVKNNEELEKQGDMNLLLRHEFLHKVGLVNENFVKNLISACGNT